MEKLLSIPELFKKSVAWYGPRLWPMLLLGLITWASSAAVMAVFGIAGLGTMAIGRHLATFNLIGILFFLVGILLLIVINLWVHVAMMYLVKAENAKANIWQLLKMVWGKMAGFYWVAILKSLAVAAGMVLFIIPGIIFSIWFAFSEYVFVFEDKRGAQALGRSRELAKGYWWPIFGRLLLIILAAILVSSVSRLGFFINSVITTPFTLVYLYVMYEDLKRVKA